MWVTDEQAAEIYARFCKARYGGEALMMATKRVSELRKAGDFEGERIWIKVAESISPEEKRRKVHSAA